MVREDFIPVCSPHLGEREKELLAECVDTGWISSEGSFVRRLEQGMAGQTGRAYGVAVSNGTAALDVAFAALDVGHGDEVVLPTFTIISCVLQVVRSGAVPIFVDCRPDTWCMDVEQVRQCLTPRTKAVLAVHIYGLPVDMDPLVRLCEEHGVTLVEDAAQAIGLTYKDRPCGGFGKLSVMSFYPNKFVTTGEGGMILTDDEELAERCRSLRNLCFEPGERFLHRELGWNCRMSNLQAAVGVAQLERLEETVERKVAIGRWYSENLKGLVGIETAPVKTQFGDNVFWAVGVVLDETLNLSGGEVMAKLAEEGIGTRPFFRPLHQQPALERYVSQTQIACPVSEGISQRGFYLPNGVDLTQNELGRVSAALRTVLEG